MNEKQVDFLIYAIAVALSMNSSKNTYDIKRMLKSKFDKLEDSQ